jgi:ribosomal protein L40E
MRCSNCGSENPSDSAFCEQCGRSLELLCPACKAPVSTSARFCRRCGANVATATIPSKAISRRSFSQDGIRLSAEDTTADLTEGERKIITALFADIKGSTELIRELDPEEPREQVLIHENWQASGFKASSSCD